MGFNAGRIVMSVGCREAAFTVVTTASTAGCNGDKVLWLRRHDTDFVSVSRLNDDDDICLTTASFKIFSRMKMTTQLTPRDVTANVFFSEATAFTRKRINYVD